ncbi:BON domain-containing protein [Coleofasciculus sp. FACHB-SPT9]|uniref:BON domain-containing protein n=1 Tax=Cyanophyceae TaxID=3028117 RepID=UPI00168A0DEA|nr:BON domain-containing protein [Coleofasciculus sp. FACHB-SPT9]MBD1889934.1 BON domain-containing protein [Coleofasciculus sp. FACHB-SPT9]
MTWLERQFGQQKTSTEGDSKHDAQAVEQQMSPGLTGEYDWELREKAGMHKPPTLPEYMGFEGEYDANGLAKRVAAAFDQEPNLKNIDTLEIAQDGGTIILTGSVPDQSILSHVEAVAAKVDGTKAVDLHQVEIKTHEGSVR